MAIKTRTSKSERIAEASAVFKDGVIAADSSVICPYPMTEVRNIVPQVSGSGSADALLHPV